MKTNKKVLIFQGGWDGHEPEKVAQRFGKILEKHGYTCTISDTQEVLADLDMLMGLDLIIPCWTMGEIKPEYRENIVKAVGAGVGLAGCHGDILKSPRKASKINGFTEQSSAYYTTTTPFFR